MAFPLFAAGAGLLLSGAGGYLNKKAAQKRQKEEAQNLYNAQKAGFQQGEKARVGKLGYLADLARSRGLADLANIPETAFKVRDYTGPVPTKASGSSFLGDVLSGAGGLASAYGSYKDQMGQQQKTQDIICSIAPELCGMGK